MAMRGDATPAEIFFFAIFWPCVPCVCVLITFFGDQ